MKQKIQRMGDNVISQKEVDEWLAEFIKRESKEHLIFVGFHGSRARDEAKVESDNDLIKLLMDKDDRRVVTGLVAT